VTAKRYSDLIVWQKAMNLVETVYKITKTFPKEETYGLSGQLRRAAVSVPSNIAEGHSRTGRREFAHYLSMAHGSLSEVETQVEIALRLGYITEQEREQVFQSSAEVGRIVVGLIRSLEKHVAAS
jgi:four helix bundle protein